MTNFQYKTFSEKPKQDTLFAEGKSSELITLREEQRDAINLAKKHFYKHKKKDGTPASCKFLWNAKMRFGKTICALQLAREMGVQRTLIVTHRPVVDKQWFKAFQQTFGNGITDNEDILSKYKYGRRSEKHNEDDQETSKYRGNFSELEKFVEKEDNHYIFFVSMQYLCLSELVNDKTRIKNQIKEKSDASKENEKLKADILNNDWDLVVIDEAHEGTRTDLGQCVIDKFLKKDKTKLLHLSGTPFNLYDDFNDNEIYTWDYVSEQRAKREWPIKHPGEPNPYADMPELNIFTFDISKDFDKYINEDGVFTFREFFRVWENKTTEGEDVPEERKGHFAHEDDVIDFIKKIREPNIDNNFPFSTDEFRNQFHHTLWLVSRVSEAKALEMLLKKDEIFKKSRWEIINVAGDVEENDDALGKVLSKIKEKPYTITISCGRLTTGVTIPEWTAVLYLRGGDTAATYMQTIFRAQSPCESPDHKKMKTACYVFDFAPDRVLKIVAETAKFSSMTKEKEEKAQKKDEETTQEKIDKDTLGEFIKYCPIYFNGQMTKFDVNTIYQKLESAYIDRLVQRGFDDPSLYNQEELNKIDPSIIDYISKNGGLAPKDESKKNKIKAKIIEVNHMTDEQRKEWEKKITKATEDAENKKKEEKAFKEQWDTWSEEQREQWREQQAEREKKRLEREEFKKRIEMIRGIALRIPLLMYGGADTKGNSETITVDNFTSKITDDSWKEFMPRGIEKEKFNEIKKCFNATRFEEAGKKYRSLTRDADSMHVEERIAQITEIFSFFRNPNKETVLTPWAVVNEHMSMTLGGYSFFDEEGKQISKPKKVDNGDITKELFDSVDKNGEIPTKILEINSKTGLYPLYVTYSLYRRRLEEYIKAECIDEKNLSVSEEQVVWDDIVAGNIYVICNTLMAVGITKRTLCGFREESVEKAHIKHEKLVEKAKNDLKALVDEIKSEGFWKNNDSKNMIKFNAAVGNPPYQDTGGAGGNNDAPLYQHFAKVAEEVTSHYVSMIMPSRWFSAGRENLLVEFRSHMLTCQKIYSMTCFTNGADVFPNVEIKGGICYYLLDEKYQGECRYSLVRNGERSTTMRKLDDFDVLIREPMFSEIVKKIQSNGKYKGVDSVISADTPFGISSNPKESKKNPLEVYESRTSEHNTKLYHIEKNKRKIEYVARQDIKKNKEYIDVHKVFIPGAGGSGIDPFVLGIPEYGPKNSVCSQSYLFASFNSEIEAKNFIKYLRTRFFRSLVASIKISQSAPNRVYRFVPLLDFTLDSKDIDWTQSVADIDQQLYKKYGINEDEQQFMKKMIKPME